MTGQAPISHAGVAVNHARSDAGHTRMTMPKLFDFIGDLTSKKVNLLRQDPENAKDYNPFIINRALSMNRETLHAANEMNQRPNLPKFMQYDFLFHIISKRYRKFNWVKKVSHPDVELVQRYCEVSYNKAMDYLKFFTKDDIQMMRDYYYEGGPQKVRGKK